MHSKLTILQVGHEKTDTGLTKGLQAPLTPFDPFSPITAEELCWIIDRLVQLEVGTSLQSVAYKIRYRGIKRLPSV